MKEFEIFVHKNNWSDFEARLSELNSKFAKKNLPLVTYKVSEENVDEITTNEARISVENVSKVKIFSAFEQSNIKGIEVQFEGVVNFADDDEKSKVCSFKNEKIPSLLGECSCDECHKKISRSKYLVFSKVGKLVENRNDLIVLGTQCAKNYFPFSVENYFNGLESELELICGEFDEYNGMNSWSKNTVDMMDLFKAVGWVTNNFMDYTGEGITRSVVENVLFDPKTKRECLVAFKDDSVHCKDVSWEEMKEWLYEAYLKPESEFEKNVHSVMFEENGKLRDRVLIKFLGIAVYSFVGAKRNHDKINAKKLEDLENSKIEWFGEKGDKFEKELVFEKMFGYETQFGYNYILLFRDNENKHVFKWSTAHAMFKVKDISGGDVWKDYKVGEKYRIKGTIKELAEYRGVKQTVITRCKVLNATNELEFEKNSENRINFI